MVELGKSIVQNDGLAEIIFILLVLDVVLRALSLAVFFEPYQNWRQKSKFGGWKIVINSSTGDKITWDIGPKKAEIIFDDPRDMDMFLKGYASSYGYRNVSVAPNDPRAIAAGMLRIDYEARVIYLDPSKDPGSQPKS